MVNVAVQDKYVQTLQAFGDIQELFDKAIQRYTIERITEKITELQERSKKYQLQYELDFSCFEKRVTEDTAFVEHIEKNITPMWELDFADWEFCEKGIDDWTRKLTLILKLLHKLEVSEPATVPVTSTSGSTGTEEADETPGDVLNGGPPVLRAADG